MNQQDDLIGKMFSHSVSKQEGWEKELRYQIMDAIAYVGINPKTSGGWTDEVKRPIVEDIIVRIKEKVLPTLLAKREKTVKEDIIKIVDIEIEAWFGAHDEMGKTFMSEDMIKHIKKRMEDYDNGSSTI